MVSSIQGGDAMIGNAVPPLLASFLAAALSELHRETGLFDDDVKDVLDTQAIGAAKRTTVSQQQRLPI